MQENRSFDHYFGALRGIRGFGNPRAVSLPSGNPVWAQPDGDGGYVLPFHRTLPSSASSFSRSAARMDGRRTRPGTAGSTIGGCRQGPMSMAYLTRERYSRFTTRWPMRSRSATRTTTRSGSPIPIATTCGRDGSATTATAAVRRWKTPRTATAGHVSRTVAKGRNVLEGAQDPGDGLHRSRILGIRATSPILGTTQTTPSSSSTSTRRPHRVVRSSRPRRSAPIASRRIFFESIREGHRGATSSPRSRRSSLRRLTPNIRTGRQTIAHGTSRRSSMR